MNIKEQLIKICKDIIKENNKEFNLSTMKLQELVIIFLMKKVCR